MGLTVQGKCRPIPFTQILTVVKYKARTPLRIWSNDKITTRAILLL